MDEDLQALGWVPTDGRGSLPFALVHGESLVAAASWAVGEAGVRLIDASSTFEQVRSAGLPLLLHDPLCPLTPVDFLERAVQTCVETGAVVVGYREVTDTIKVRDGDVLGATVDRSRLRSVTSPVVIPAEVLAGLGALDSTDLAALVGRLAEVAEIHWLPAPPIARRIAGKDDLVVLEALSRSLT
ncbi:2-C-methyl-D-erythritol 4-phosphate cytidylyltransferase [Nocardioides marmorisolisilvae]|uniref:2-C-methyl-D-erythritol 4-phosphate cytidylyltransferase n=1 Tax=Nocardioides marmorisolisilvae TaxID=1542737 RepID=UPI001FE7410C|nr:2-C-methyl-D-erythritol 4-phosphate cytidylyltransferase [Nocardioides marmorisolisilvae]